MIEPISRIQEKLAQLKQLDKSLKIFGAKDHHYQMKTPLQDTYLASMEREIGINLPAGYRRFLTKIGNGGAGPYYGIDTLETSLARWREWTGDYRYLCQDFPLKDDCDFSEECNAPPSWEQHVSMLRRDSGYRKRWNTVIKKYSNIKTWFQGTLFLCEYGCGDYFFMVVRGEVSDAVWVRSPETGIYSLKIDFLGWYENWLDDSIKRVQAGDFMPPNKSYSFLQYGNNSRYGTDPWSGNPG